MERGISFRSRIQWVRRARSFQPRSGCLVSFSLSSTEAIYIGGGSSQKPEYLDGSLLFSSGATREPLAKKSGRMPRSGAAVNRGGAAADGANDAN
jgi:hypothetical protein